MKKTISVKGYLEKYGFKVDVVTMLDNWNAACAEDERFLEFPPLYPNVISHWVVTAGNGTKFRLEKSGNNAWNHCYNLYKNRTKITSKALLPTILKKIKENI